MVAAGGRREKVEQTIPQTPYTLPPTPPTSPVAQSRLEAKCLEAQELVKERTALSIERATLEAQKEALTTSGQAMSLELTTLRSKNGGCRV